MKAARSPRRHWKDAAGPGNGRKRETIAKENLKSFSQKTGQRPKADGGIRGLARSPTFPLACTAARIFSNDGTQRPILTFNPDDGLRRLPRSTATPEYTALFFSPEVGLEGRWLLAGETVEATVVQSGGAFRVAAGGDTGVGTGTAGFGLTLPVAEATTLVGNFDGALTTEHAWRATGYLGLTYSF